MPFLKQHNLFTKTFIITGLALIIYGYSAKIFHIYFFWESIFIGWMVGLAGVIGFILTWIKQRRLLKKSTIVQKIGIGILSFLLLLQAIFLIVLPRTDAYKAAKEFLRNEESIKNELGIIRDFTIIPLGSISVSSSENKTIGEATLIIIVKGEKKFRQYQVSLVKEADSGWKVYELR